MEYGNLVRRAWQLTWRNRFLWVLGLFAPSTVGSCSGSGGSGRSFDFDTRSGAPSQLPAELNRLFEQVVVWVGQHLALIVLGVAVALAIGLLLLIVSLIAQGGIARATADLAVGRPITAGEAWRAGVGLFWRFLGLWLALLGISLAVLLCIGLVGLVGFLIGQAVDGAVAVLLIVIGGLFGLVLVLAAIPFFIGLSVTFTLAQRAVVIEDVGPVSALRAGLKVLLANLGTTLLVWLVSLALSIGVGIAVLVGLLVLLIPLVALGAALFFSAGVSLGLVAYAAAGVIALIIFAWLLSAIPNTFFWNYWTLAYLRLTGRLEALGE